MGSIPHWGTKIPRAHLAQPKKQKQNPNSNNKRNITETKIPKYRIKDNNQRIGQELRSQLWTETLQFAESAIIMSVLHHFGTLSKMSLLFSHQFTGIDLCLDSWSVSPPRWVLRDQVTHFIITETETNGRWNLCQINSGKPVSWGKKKNRVDFHLYFFNYRHSYVYGYATCMDTINLCPCFY